MNLPCFTSGGLPELTAQTRGQGCYAAIVTPSLAAVLMTARFAVASDGVGVASCLDAVAIPNMCVAYHGDAHYGVAVKVFTGSSYCAFSARP